MSSASSSIRQETFTDRKVTAVEIEAPVALSLCNPRERPKVRERDAEPLPVPSPGKPWVPFRGCAATTWSRASSRSATQVAMNRPSPGFASSNWPVSAAAQPPQDAVAHDHDFLDLELGDRKLQRRRDAVAARSRLERRSEVADVADDEHLARLGIEDDRRLDPAVRTGDDQHLGALALREFRPARSFLRPIGEAKTAISLKQVGKLGHGRALAAAGRGWQAADPIAIWRS